MNHIDKIRDRVLVSDCELWTGPICTKGYGQVWIDGTSHLVHRLAYESAHGPIPAGLVIDHTCHDPRVCVGGRTCLHRRCVNPDHLAAVSNEANLRRQSPAFKTHCKRGHEFTPDNTGRSRGGRRYCIACQRLQAATWKRQASHRGPDEVTGTEIREWARSAGFVVRERGVLPNRLVAAWNAEHPERPYRRLKAAS